VKKLTNPRTSCLGYGSLHIAIGSFELRIGKKPLIRLKTLKPIRVRLLGTTVTVTLPPHSSAFIYLIYISDVGLLLSYAWL
jgi:hypothetical protein